LVDGITDDGTLPPTTVDRVLRVLSARLQTKMWNADAEATRQTYRRKADDAWEEYSNLEPTRTWGWGHPLIPVDHPLTELPDLPTRTGRRLGRPRGSNRPLDIGRFAQITPGGCCRPDGRLAGGGGLRPGQQSRKRGHFGNKHPGQPGGTE
jgi:hypothetical protein